MSAAMNSVSDEQRKASSTPKTEGKAKGRDDAGRRALRPRPLLGRVRRGSGQAGARPRAPRRSSSAAKSLDDLQQPLRKDCVASPNRPAAARRREGCDEGVARREHARLVAPVEGQLGLVGGVEPLRVRAHRDVRERGDDRVEQRLELALVHLDVRRRATRTRGRCAAPARGARSTTGSFIRNTSGMPGQEPGVPESNGRPGDLGRRPRAPRPRERAPSAGGPRCSAPYSARVASPPSRATRRRGRRTPSPRLRR